jgi:hypothetical protein
VKADGVGRAGAALLGVVHRHGIARAVVSGALIEPDLVQRGALCGWWCPRGLPLTERTYRRYS